MIWWQEFSSLAHLPLQYLPMPRKLTVKLRCPICKKSVKSTDPDFPFCSDRCRLIDLGKWASGDYKISSPVTDTEESIRDRDPEDPDSEF